MINDRLEVVAFNESFALLLRHVYQYKVKRLDNLSEVLKSDDETYWIPLVQAALGGRSHEEVRTLRFGKKDIYVNVQLKCLHDEDGNTAVMVEISDITRETNNELFLSAFRKLAHNLPNTDVFLCDNQLNVLIAAGGEMKKFNANPEHFQGNNMLDLAAKFDIQLLLPCYEKALKGEANSVEYGYGESYYCVEAHPVIEDGEIQNIIVLSRNITDLKTANLKLEQLNQTKDRILSIVAHDLRNPLSSILGVIELAAEHPDQMLQHRAMIERSCNSALSTISDLLDISELGREHAPLQTERVNLNDFVKEQLENHRVLADTKQITFVFKPEEVDVVVKINPDKFSRVLNNLLTNAVKFSKPGYSVTVSTVLKGKKICMKVKDEGIGIPSDMQQYIFDRFSRAGRKGTAGERSVGLGLSIVKQIVKLHDGTIKVTSAENKGTEVCIELDSAI